MIIDINNRSESVMLVTSLSEKSILPAGAQGGEAEVIPREKPIMRKQLLWLRSLGVEALRG